MFTVNGHLKFTDRANGSNDRWALIGDVAEDLLTGAFGAPTAGVWNSGWDGFEDYNFTQVDGVTYYEREHRELPSDVPAAGESLADDASVVKLLTRMQEFEPYFYDIRRENPDHLGDRIETHTGGGTNDITLFGSAWTVRDGDPILVVVYELEDAAAAEASLSVLEESLTSTATIADLPAPSSVYVDDTFVIGEFNLDGYRLAGSSVTLLQFSTS